MDSRICRIKRSWRSDAGLATCCDRARRKDLSGRRAFCKNTICPPHCVTYFPPAFSFCLFYCPWFHFWVSYNLDLAQFSWFLPYSQCFADARNRINDRLELFPLLPPVFWTFHLGYG